MPETRENEMLAERLQSLQSEVRRIKEVGISVAALLVIFILLFRIQTHRKVTAEEVVAQDFVLTDSLGRVRTRLTVFPGGSASKSMPPAASAESGSSEAERKPTSIPTFRSLRCERRRSTCFATKC
jgi:hypothetical protein